MDKNEIRENIRKEVERMAELEEGSLGYSDKFAEKGVDSFVAVQLVAMLEDDYDITIPDEKIDALTCVDDVVRVIGELAE